ncbi:Uncharacterised protein [Myroides odoratus]|uniref:Lipoprotein n=2 Tax=Myroides odoratus TaxID=256 RepID=A0A378RNB3_MYROD|nr:hypothetical protein I6I89_01865 [Myroides odoratus]STZ28542.1 Uncharacterised protein [Myroides odoratus]
MLKKMQKAFALACAVWLIFSTCSMQTSLNHLLGDTTTPIEQTTKTNKSKKYTTVTERSCGQSLSIDDHSQVLQKAGWDLTNPFIALVVSTFLIFFFGIRIKGESNKNPAYQDTSQLQGKLPLFIEFQNLRI